MSWEYFFLFLRSRRTNFLLFPFSHFHFFNIKTWPRFHALVFPFFILFNECDWKLIFIANGFEFQFRSVPFGSVVLFGNIDIFIWVMLAQCDFLMQIFILQCLVKCCDAYAITLFQMTRMQTSQKCPVHFFSGLFFFNSHTDRQNLEMSSC